MPRPVQVGGGGGDGDLGADELPCLDVGDAPWHADPDDSALTLAWVTDLHGSPGWPGGWFAHHPATPLPDLGPGEASTLTTRLPHHALRGLPPGPVGVRASLLSLGLRTPPAQVDLVGETVPLPPRYHDW